MRKFILIALIAVFLMQFPVNAQKEDGSSGFVTDVSGVGTSAATFLEIGVGSRASALGGAYAAVANDVSALYWNPAGIAWIDGVQTELMHTEWLANTSYDFVGIVTAIPLVRSSFGVSITSLDYGESPVRTVERPEGTGEKYGARDMAIAVTYAMALTDRFSFGLSGKYISQRIWSESGTATALDVGVFYNTMLKGLKLGASMSNFGSEISLSGRHLTTIHDPDPLIENFDRVPVDYKTGSYQLPLLFRVGISYERSFGKMGKTLFALDVNHPSNATESINMGFEYGFANMFYFRSGYESMFERDGINGLTIGGGVDYYLPGSMGIRLDYSWADWGILENAQRFSLGLKF